MYIHGLQRQGLFTIVVTIGRGGAAEQAPVGHVRGLFGLIWPEFSTNSPGNTEKGEKQVNASVHGCMHSGSLCLTGALGTLKAQQDKN